ncbi:S-type pyocin domain-containing protein [Pectobacterium betavasculorum]|uniref:S-type pyocin domain-containing protein n=1 Tax=Pectobacterium betavasculorum TaxID=55207 RepID=UPI000A8789C4|nr:S-type pyocin domain-containing protein [Pectobacterium betavasculorum]
MKYSLCAPNDGDTMTVSGGGGFSGDVDRGSAWSGGGNGGDRRSSDNGGNKNNNPVRLFTGGPIIVVKDGLRYYGIIIDDDSNLGPFIEWRYDGNADDSSTKLNVSSINNIPGFGFAHEFAKIQEVLSRGEGEVVAPGLIFIKGQYKPRGESTEDYMLSRADFYHGTLPMSLIHQVFISGNKAISARLLTNEKPGYTGSIINTGKYLALKRANDYFHAKEYLAREKFPSVFTLRGIASSTPSSASSMQFAIAGGGGAAISDSGQIRLTQLLSEFWSTASRIATASTAGPIAAVLSLLTYSSKVGVGSDKVPGRNDEMMFSIPVKNLPGVTLPDNMADLASNKGSVNLPVRAAFVEKDGKMSLNLFKTGNTHVSASVKVVKGEFDKDTSTFRTEIFGVPDHIILESPAKAPTATVGNTARPQPDYKIPTHTGVEVKPVDTLTVTTTPVAEPVEFYDYIIWTPTADGTGVEPVYVVFNSNPYGGTEKGKYSKRYYNPEKAGGSILELDWKNVKVDRAGVDNVKLHTGRFKASVENKVMIERLENILNGQITITDTDKRFYTHELRELERYRNLGIKDGEVPSSIQEESSVWNDTHTATLEDYKINEKEQPLYTDAALQAAYEQELKDALGGKHG